MIRFYRKEHRDLTVTILRFAVGSVFLWFGLDKWIHPEAWEAWITVWLWPLDLIRPAVVMFLAGVFEFAVGLLLVAGRLIRPVCVLSGLYLLLVTLLAGVSDVAVRDVALVGACVALFINENAMARHNRVRDRYVRWVAIAYVLYLFVIGILFLKHGLPTWARFDFLP